MKIVVISDTHGDSYALHRVLMIENDAAMFLHAGDVGLRKDESSPFACVAGNCDGAFRSEYPSELKLDTPIGKIYMRHYPLYDRGMVASLREEGVRFIIHGHTHRREDAMCEGVRLLCPGSLAYPRDNPKGTYLVIEIREGRTQVSFKEI